ncbi:hypothetical protein BGZ58_002629 [Dissophora ornata]|nr:hypothetical protein BGZ58_002629 [Dissophora ornata]
MPHSKSDTLPEALLRNLPHIRGIYFGDQDSQDHHHHPSSAPSDLKSLLLQCRNLTTLQLNNLSDEMMTLLEYNLNTIQRIVYHSNSFKVLRQKPLWDILDSMPRLRHLELKHVNIGAKNSSQGEAFVKICERLEAMHLIICTLGDWPSFEQGQPGRFPKMKQLEFMFVNEPYTQLQMIRQYSISRAVPYSTLILQPSSLSSLPLATNSPLTTQISALSSSQH